MPNGYLIGTAMFGLLLVALVWAQIRAKTFNPWLYWATIVASTTCGTTLADFADRSLGIGYPGGSLLLLACVLASLFAWHRTPRDGRRQHVSTAARRDLLLDHDHLLADARNRAWRLDRATPGSAIRAERSYSALRSRCSLCSISRPSISRVGLFWAAFILTRPLGATVGDFLDKPIAKGGLEFSRPLASAVLAVVIIALILLLPQRPGGHPAEWEASLTLPRG